MFTLTTALEQVEARGTRYAIIGTIRKGEARCVYAPTADLAEWQRRQFEDDLGYRNVQVHPPVEHADDLGLLATLAKDRAAARAALDDVTSQVRALACRLVTDEVVSEADAARRAGVDRMTIRQWLGKR